ncbi:UDP-N-acetylmuramoyl-tripeptide--D-alanyl-D-alanine ligase [Loktanella sp. D2R18]|uniref:Mur ligase family protein n=1 Tax=Rhodobacterales TaxID=204455 RepID=UPI000DE999F7|nr:MULTISPECIES: Mur ligase family protein [Rhodobacterales]MDO6590258.1 Mur ligase family protein [Yoonia sp. 1_MG-2023]RBW42932.1 UDP-N-acetylmuramoyl-tripeptide--D-alanyl-D-alanine ligase [Loktanella sp. D2R18]
MTALWAGEDVIAAIGSQGSDDWNAFGISTDADTTKPGDLFVAVNGAVKTAFANGAVAAIVSDIDKDITQPQLKVADPRAALADLARAARFRSRAKIVAVSGSAGKTATVGMLHEMLAGQGRCHAPLALGQNVALALATLPQEADFAVIKCCAGRAKETAQLVRLLQPQVALVMGADVTAAEIALIATGLSVDGFVIFHGEDTPTKELDASIAQRQVIRFGAAGNDWTLRQVRLGADVTVVMAKGMGQDYLFKLGVPGRQFALYALGALAAVTAIGADPVTATLDLARWAPPAGRGSIENIVLDPARDGETLRLINDAANAHPATMDTAFEVIATSKPNDNVGRIVKGRRVAFLGDMGGVNTQSAVLHRNLAANEYLQKLDQVHCIGPQIYPLWRALPQHQRGQWAQTASDLAPQVSKLVDAGDVVLVKGTASSKTTLVVDAIRKLGHRRPQEE